MAFDVNGALAAGYSPAEVADFLGKGQNYDVGAARKAGYSDDDILSHLSGGSYKPTPSMTSQVVSGTADALGMGSGNTVRTAGQVVGATPDGTAATGLGVWGGIVKGVGAVADEFGKAMAPADEAVLKAQGVNTTPTGQAQPSVGEAADQYVKDTVAPAAANLQARGRQRVAAVLADPNADSFDKARYQAGQQLEDVGKRAQDYYSQQMQTDAPAMVAADKAVQDANGFVDTVKAYGKNPLAIVSGVAQSAPDMVVGAALSRGAATVARGLLEDSAKAAGDKAFQEALLKAASDPSTLGSARRLAAEARDAAVRDTLQQGAEHAAAGTGLGVESLQSGGATRAQVQDFVGQQSDEQLRANSPRYVELLKTHSSEDARKILGDELGNQAAGQAAVWTGLAGKASGAADAWGHTIAGAPITWRQAVGGTAKEGLEEFLQNPGEDFAGYQAKKQVDPTQQFDLGGSAAQGLVVGLAQGGALHGGGHAVSAYRGELQPTDVKLAGRPITAYSDDQLKAYAASGALTAEVRAKVDGEIARRADAAGTTPATPPAAEGDALDSAVQRFATDTGAAADAGAGSEVQGADARPDHRADGADRQPAAGRVDDGAGPPLRSDLRPEPAAVPRAVDGTALNDAAGSVIPQARDPLNPLQTIEEQHAQERADAISRVKEAQASANLADYPAGNPLDNLANADNASSRAGARLIVADHGDSASSGVSYLGAAPSWNDAGRVAGQSALDRLGLGESTPRMGRIEDPRLLTQALGVADVMHSLSGNRPIVYHDARPNAVDGFEHNGRAYINAANLEQGIHFTLWHETYHTAETRAAQGDVAAQQFVKTAQTIFDMISPEGKAKYAREYAFKNEIASGDMTLDQALAHPKLRSEMVADFFGKRGEDIRFLRHLAQRDPANFGGFIRRWIDSLTNLINEFRAKRDLGAKDIDQHIRKLSHAKAVAASALIEWRRANPALAVKLPAVGETRAAISGSEKSGPQARDIVGPELHDHIESMRAEADRVNSQASPISAEQRARLDGYLAKPLEMAGEATPEFTRRLQNIAHQVGGHEVIADIKDGKRAAEKIAVDHNFDPAKIGDLVRGTVVVPTLDKVAHAIEAVGRNFDIADIKDRISKPNESGYRDVSISVQLPNGLKGEIQIQAPEHMAVKSLGHVLYELARAQPEGSPRVAALNDLGRQIHDRAHAQAMAKLKASAKAPTDMGQVSWESQPGRVTGVLPGIHDATYQQQTEFQRAIVEALTGPNGEDLLAKQLGLQVEGKVPAPGVWRADVGAGMQYLVPMAPLKGGGAAVAPEQAARLNDYARVLGLLLRQDGVGWHRPFYTANGDRANGVDVRIGQPLSPEEMKSVWTEVDRTMQRQGVADWENKAALISSPTGVRLVNFGTMENRAFYRAMAEAVERAFPGDIDVKLAKFQSDGNLVTNDWKASPHGEDYSSGLGEARRSALLGFARGVLAPRVQAAFDDFSKRYGWGNPGQLNFSAKQRAGGGQPRAGSTAAGQAEAPERAAPQAGREEVAPLPGAPNVPGFHGPDPRLVRVAEDYAKSRGITLRRQAEYVKVDEARAKRIAQAYADMPHAPQDPKVKAAYADLISQALGQYRALEKAGYKFWFIDLSKPSNQDYVSTPWNAMRDIRANQEMGIFPTADGFGTNAEFDPEGNPLLADTGIKWPVGGPDGKLATVYANDIFRAVHDAFGHGLEGAGFRAQGEENAWQAHARLFTGPALGALTSETRGQNSWLNYGPHGEANRTAKVEDTVFADQKTGLMPEWTWTEGRAGDAPSFSRKQSQTETPEFKSWFGESKVVDADGKPLVVYHGTNSDIDTFDTGKTRAADVIFTTPDPAGASIYAETRSAYRGAANVMPLYVRIERPAVIKDTEYGFDALNAAASRGDADGVLVVDEKGVIKIAAPFSAEQIKSAIGNSGQFDPSSPDIRHSTKQADIPEESRVQAGRRVVQDQYIRMRQLQQWAKDNGANPSKAADPYGTEERMHGRVASRFEDFREKVVHPLVDATQRAGFTMGQVEEVLHAMHAEERNRQIAKINPEMPDGGSGMTTADAKAILAKASPALVSLAQRWQGITDQTREVLLKGGIISQDMASAWDKAYQHYVPLKGGDEEDAAQRSGTGKGLGVNGKSKRALGHGERDEHIVENMLRDHERAILLAEKNRVGQAMMLWLNELNDPRIGTIDQPVKRAVLRPSFQHEVRLKGVVLATLDTDADARRWVQRQIDRKIPGARQMKVSKVQADQSVSYMASPMLESNEAQVYVNGHAVRMQLNDPLLAQAYNKLNADQMNVLIKSARVVNTYLSKAYTGYNPAFIFRNAIRDFGSGLVKLTGNYGAGTTSKIVARYPAALGQLLRYSLSNGAKSTASIDAYRANGGSTGAAYLSDLERVGADITKRYQDYLGAKALWQQGQRGTAARVAAGKVIDKLVGLIEHLNMATENAMRLATFEQIKEETGSVEEAASAAKNSTVNFNRKGEMGGTLGALYLFFNPNVQDTASVLETLMKGKHKRQAQMLCAAMASLAYLMASRQFGGGDDDYDRWKKIPDNVRDKNMVIRTGEDSYITVPVPFGFGFFHTLGNTLFMAQKGEDMNQLSVGVASNLADHFSPVGNPLQGAKGWDKIDKRGMVELLPGVGAGDLTRDAYRWFVNRSSLGGDIVPDSKFDEGRPNFLREFRSTKGTPYDAVARGMSNLTGGTDTQGGLLDVSPETLKFWSNAVTGGTGAFVSDMAHLAGLGARAVAAPAGEDVSSLKPEKSEIPILRDYFKEERVQDARRAFWDAASEAKGAMADFRRAAKSGDEVGMARVEQEKGEMMALAGMAQGYGKMIKAQRDRVDEINADSSTSLAFKRAAIKQLEREEAEVYSEYVHAVTMAKSAKGK